MKQDGNNQKIEENNTPRQVTVKNPLFDGRNASFTVDGKSITLVNGVSEMPVEDSSAKVSTRYLGNPVKGDLNGDGLEDHAFLSRSLPAEAVRFIM